MASLKNIRIQRTAIAQEKGQYASNVYTFQACADRITEKGANASSALKALFRDMAHSLVCNATVEELVTLSGKLHQVFSAINDTRILITQALPTAVEPVTTQEVAS